MGIKEMKDFMPEAYERYVKGICTIPGCGATDIPSNLRDKDSQKEYMISGMCQACQDKVFGGD